ncbi:MAG: uroporphyrinogen-III C-methyltransferase [Candidatus Aureabacteria bacterium]|nr:uroporphyrinogen-III C-methyltransferase [Candidatus Auribacterota bacterium]
MVIQRMGRVFLVGAGPGDPTLITEKGKSLLSLADVILYDHLANPSLLRFAREDAEKICVGKSGGRRSISQSAINRLLVREARRGKLVIRLKGGDPILFGRGAEETLCLSRERIPFEIIPGVSAALAVPVCAGIPLTMRGVSSSVTILTGHEADGGRGRGVDWGRLLRADSTFVVLMGVKNLEEIVNRFLAAGKSPRLPAALIERGTTPLQRTVVGPLGRIARIGRKRRVAAPAILVVGETVALRRQLRSAATFPLRGARVLVTRPAGQAERIVRLLERNGAVPLVYPLIRIEPARSFGPLDRAIAAITRYDWIIFTSANGVQAFMGRLDSLGYDSRALARAEICAIGPATEAELWKWGLRADCLPKEFTTEGIIDALTSRGEIEGRLFLLPRSQLAGEALPGAIRRLGGRCVEAAVYRALPSRDSARAIMRLIEEGGVDLVVLTSPSAVGVYAKMLKRSSVRKFHEPVIAVIGPVTGQAAVEHGLRVVIKARTHADEGLVRALVNFWKGKGKAKAAHRHAPP